MSAQTAPTESPSFHETIQSAWKQQKDVAQRYKAAENATRPFAKLMVDISEQLTTLKTTPVRIFDLGSGTGAVEAEIYAAVPKDQWCDLQVLAGDVSQPMVEYLSQRAREEGWSGVQTQVMDGAKLDQADLSEGFGHVFVGFTIFMLPDGTIQKLAQKVTPGGTLAMTSWARLPWFDLLKQTIERLQDGPEMPSQESVWQAMTNGLPWQQAEYVREQLQQAGLQKVEVVQKKYKVDCGTPETFMTTMVFVLQLLSSQWPEEKKEGWLKEVSETMKAIVVEQSGGEDKHTFLDFEGIVGVGLKGE